MDAFQILNIITCLSSTVTAVVVCVALLPHIKDGMVIIRDVILWLAFIALLAGLGWLGFEHYKNTRPIVTPNIDLRDDRADSYYAGR